MRKVPIFSGNGLYEMSCRGKHFIKVNDVQKRQKHSR